VKKDIVYNSIEIKYYICNEKVLFKPREEKENK